MNQHVKYGVVSHGCRCPLCGQVAIDPVLIVAVCEALGIGVEDGLQFGVCPQHALPRWLLDWQPQLRPFSAAELLDQVARKAALLTGTQPPSLRRPAIRIQLPGERPGQVAPSRRAWRQSLARGCDRALGLLATLFARVFTAGERVQCLPRGASDRTRSGRGERQVLMK